MSEQIFNVKIGKTYLYLLLLRGVLCWRNQILSGTSGIVVQESPAGALSFTGINNG